MSRVSIVIVGYNPGENMVSCLKSIYEQTLKDFEVIYVDNGSTDDTPLILENYPDVINIKNDANKGFCIAVNEGIRKAHGSLILTLNSDVVLDKDFLKVMCESAQKSEAGLFGARILSMDGKVIDSTGLVLSNFYRFFDRGRNEIDKGQYDKGFDIFGPCAAAALYKREMLEDIKYDGQYFDEDFFFLGEDFDMAWRADKMGWRAQFVPSAVCYHMRNSTNFNPKYRQYLSFRNRYFLLIKNAESSFKYFIVFFLYDIPRFIFMLCTNKYTLRAVYEMIRYTSRMLRKRCYINEGCHSKLNRG